jgi:hypothetical protein
MYFFLGMAFAALGAVFLVLAVGLATGCGEVQRQLDRLPGVAQWYAIPYCENLSHFDNLYTTLTSEEEGDAKNVCFNLLSYCSTTSTYSNSDPNMYFYCPFTSSNYATVCANYAAAKVVIQQVVAKTTSPVCGGTACSYTSCGSDCTVSAVKTSAVTNLKLLTDSSKLASAAAIVAPFTDCNVIGNMAASSVSGACPYLRDGMWKIGFACFFSSILFAIGIIVLFRGQKVFFKPTSTRAPLDDDSNPSHAPARN